MPRSFTGMAALLGAVLDLSFVFAGTAGVNPAMVLVSGALSLAWRNAGWIGLDRWVLPELGTPWHRGELFDHRDVRTPPPVEPAEPRPEDVRA